MKKVQPSSRPQLTLNKETLAHLAVKSGVRTGGTVDTGDSCKCTATCASCVKEACRIVM